MFSMISLLAVILILGLLAIVVMKPFSTDCPHARAGATTTTLLGSLPPALQGQLQTCG
jgi:Tfp pilus assembly protein PilE